MSNQEATAGQVTSEQRGRLVLRREPEERVILRTASGELIIVTVLDVRGQKVGLHFDAPRSVIVDRAEVFARRDAA